MNIKENNINSISICDLCDDMYVEKINFEFSKNDSDKFIECIKKLEETEDGFNGILSYAICINGNAANEIEKLFVDINGIIGYKNGPYYRKNDEINELLLKYENEFGISEKLMERTPGKNYFGLIEMVDNGACYETVSIEEGTFNENSLSKDKILAMFSNINFETVNFVKEDFFDVKYCVNLYTKDGCLIYSMNISENFGEYDLYTDFGYKIEFPELKQFVDNLIK